MYANIQFSFALLKYTVCNIHAYRIYILPNYFKNIHKSKLCTCATDVCNTHTHTSHILLTCTYIV